MSRALAAVEGIRPQVHVEPEHRYMTADEIRAAERKQTRLWLKLVILLLAHVWGGVASVVLLWHRPWGQLIVAAIGFTLVLTALTTMLVFMAALDEVHIGEGGVSRRR